MPFHPKLSPEQRARIKRIANIRRALPSDKELALEMGVTEHAVRRWMREPKEKEPKVQIVVPQK